MGTRVPFPRTQDFKTQPTTEGQLRPPSTKLVKQGTHIFQLRSEARQHNRFRRRSTTHEQSTTRQQSDTEPPPKRTAIHSSEGKHKTGARGATHRVVSPGYGRLSGGVRIHGVDDCLPLAFLVDLPKAPTGLSVRGLSLKVLLIFIHIVHLEMIGREGDGERGEWLSSSSFKPFMPPPPKKKTHTHARSSQKPHPPILHLAPPPPPPLCLPPLSLRKNRCVCGLHDAHLRQRVLTTQKERQRENKHGDERGIWREGDRARWGVDWLTDCDKQRQSLMEWKTSRWNRHSLHSLGLC